jgi:hypothetical protein
MGLQMAKLWLATSCGSPRQYDSQYRDQTWSDPPRAVTLIEWVHFLAKWHRILHAAGYCGRSAGWPPAPPTIWEFSESSDLPIADWALENAKRYSWTDKLELAARQAARHEYLRSLSHEARLGLYKMERWMRHLERDRDWALQGWIETRPGVWHWRRPLLSDARPAKGSQ